MEHYEPVGDKEAWLRYLAAERQALLLRANGLLSHALSGARLDGSGEDLELMASEDARLAREGLVKLLSEDGSVSLKHIDDLRPGDVPAKRRSEVTLLAFLMERIRGRLESSARRLPRPPQD